MIYTSDVILEQNQFKVPLIASMSSCQLLEELQFKMALLPTRYIRRGGKGLGTLEHQVPISEVLMLHTKQSQIIMGMRTWYISDYIRHLYLWLCDIRTCYCTREHGDPGTCVPF